MTYPIKNVKIIHDPLWGLIDITSYLPMIDTPEFQALGFKYQLGITSLLFPAATHTRKQHSFGALKRTQELANRWIHQGFITKEDARLIIAYALWHDIGHGPFSHVIEDVTKEIWDRNHDENGTLLVRRLRPAVEAVGINFEEFIKLFTHENPLYLAVHDKNLGTEKLDYLSRDAYYTIGEKPGVEYLARHTYFIDNRLLVDEKAIDNAKNLQDFYIKMYKTVYLRKASAISQRIVQRMVYELLKTEPMREEDFWALTDFGLMGLLENAQDPSVRLQARQLLNRDLPRTAVALKIEQFVNIEQREDKAQIILGISEDQMRKLLNSAYLSTPSHLQRIEEKIAQMVGIPPSSVLLVPAGSLDRFVPKDILIYGPGGQIGHLSDYFESHFRAMDEEGKSYTVIRICTFEEHREKLSSPIVARHIKEYLLSLV